MAGPGRLSVTDLDTFAEKLAYIADLEAEVEDWRGAVGRLLEAWPDDDAGFDAAMHDLAHLFVPSSEHGCEDSSLLAWGEHLASGEQ